MISFHTLLSIKMIIIEFIIMILVGIFFNPMNMLAYRFDDLYLSLTLFYGGLLMGSNMIWAHELIHYLSVGHINMKNFILGLGLSVIIVVFLLRNQWYVDDKQWLRRMISHHSTALTTSHKIVNITKNNDIKKLATDIIKVQEEEISLMKKML
jgi:hypothetical protein